MSGGSSEVQSKKMKVKEEVTLHTNPTDDLTDKVINKDKKDKKVSNTTSATVDEVSNTEKAKPEAEVSLGDSTLSKENTSTVGTESLIPLSTENGNLTPEMSVSKETQLTEENITTAEPQDKAEDVTCTTTLQVESKIVTEVLYTKEVHEMSFEELKEEIVTLREATLQKNRLLNEMTNSNPKYKQGLSCAICVDYFKTPCTAECGHTFCYCCLNEWLKVRKECPSCRKKISRRPYFSFSIKELVESYLDQLNSLREDVQKHTIKLEMFDDDEDPWEGVFPLDGAGVIVDSQDNVSRCPRCSWEVVGRECANCGLLFSDMEDEEDEEEDEEGDEEEEEESDSQNSFIDDEAIEDNGNEDSQDASDEEPEYERRPRHRYEDEDSVDEADNADDWYRRNRRNSDEEDDEPNEDGPQWDEENDHHRNNNDEDGFSSADGDVANFSPIENDSGDSDGANDDEDRESDKSDEDENNVGVRTRLELSESEEDVMIPSRKRRCHRSLPKALSDSE
ncbi:E3 ubiquitin ligase [Basidiobolus ranarum]|uniref:E3 ubiquitin ligase n=1 Tax=Basidiobolus ranarum TaxID=34480 RepID=A0ABR2WLN7_9FUNG